MTARVFFAWVLIVFGALFVLFAGGCTLLILGDGGVSLFKDTLGMLVWATFAGGPLMIGTFMLVLGLVLRSRERREGGGGEDLNEDDTPAQQ